MQVSLEVEEPPVQVHPVSTLHVELHPSLLDVLPSSQYVDTELNRLLSPQISEHVSLEVEEPPVQVHPVSTLHVELHPSLFAVLPSSHLVVKVLNRLLSPHISVHVSLEVEEPPVQVHPVSTLHVELHPSLLDVLPSSQYVDTELNRLLSPQISEHVSLEVEEPPVQVHPVSTLHVELHPSLFAVLPSSHLVVKVLNRLLSPHISVHVSLEVEEPPVQVHPVSTLHVELHPSLFAVLPSSQYVDTELNRLLSPQISEHVSLEVEEPPVQVHPVSTLHVELHPSLFAVLPSSHLVVKVLNRLLSPHISVHVSLEVEEPPVQVHPVSTLHVELHPSLLDVLPSSQYADTELNRLLSPQISEHVSLEVEEPPVQVHPVSTLHVELHPSLLDVLPSSQYADTELNRLLSPQISEHVSLEVEEPPVQVHPVSTLHVELHPSLFAVLPSSHLVVKVLNRLLSPHISVHVSLEVEEPPVQVHPVSTLHVELHPSLLDVLPSSQYADTELNRLLSPQISVHVSLEVKEPPVQVHPVSTLHVELHPSLLDVLPSSQYADTELNRLLSPQISEHVSLEVEEPPVQVHPVSTLHVELHPSLLDVLPSSQYADTELNRLLSPQISVHVSLEVKEPPVQVHPVSTLHCRATSIVT